jgi:hypothetical protein
MTVLKMHPSWPVLANAGQGIGKDLAAAGLAQSVALCVKVREPICQLLQGVRESKSCLMNRVSGKRLQDHFQPTTKGSLEP